MIDDFNYFVNKERAQEELLYTLYSLTEKKAIIVISTDTSIPKGNYNKQLKAFLSCGLKLKLKNASVSDKESKIKEIMRENDFSISKARIEEIFKMQNLQNNHPRFFGVSLKKKMFER